MNSLQKTNDDLGTEDEEVLLIRMAAIKHPKPTFEHGMKHELRK